MLLVVIIGLFQCLFSCINANVDKQVFSQLLDHDSATKTYWNQTYFLNNQYWPGTTKNATVFLMVGGEDAINEYFIENGAWMTWAQNHSALLFMLEHRFYGTSHPTSDVSDSNLIKYMSSQMALADINYFIDQINEAYKFESPRWILFGGSYSGSLAAWARLKYPDNVYGSVASSGPLQATVNFYQYFDVAAQALDYYYPGCSGEVTKAVKSIQKMMDSKDLTSLNSNFSICENSFNASNIGDRVYFFDQVAGDIAKTAVQYNKQLQDDGIDKVCSYMNNRSISDPVVRLSKYYKSSHSACIYANNAVQTAFFKKTGWNDQFNSQNLRQWRFQLCNEFAFFQTSENKRALFSDAFPLSYYTQQCTDVFGSNFNAQQLQKSVAKTNKYYGGTNIKVTRVAFVQGLLDPWYPVGIIQNPSEDSPLYTEFASHTYDTGSPRYDDPPSVTLARQQVGQNIYEWLSA